MLALALETLRRFPLVVACGAAAAAAAILLSEEAGPDWLNGPMLAAATLGLPLGTAATLLSERARSRVARAAIAVVTALVLVWVHAALVDSGLAASALFGTPLTAADADSYVAEMTIAAELLGAPHEMVPDSVAALERYIAGVRPQLRRTPAAAESMGYLLDPPGLDEDIAELWQDIRDAAVAALPGWAREMYGYPEPPPLTAGRRTEIRQALGVLDAVFLGEPGVLEARQRLAVRMRSAAAK